METDQLGRHWHKMKEKHGLPTLRPKDLRHWVSTCCRKAGLSRAASAYMQGHDAAAGGGMRDWYDNETLDAILEEQGRELPRGPLGLIMGPEVEIVDSKPTEVLALVDGYLAGRVGTIEFATKMETFRMKLLASPTV